MSLVYVLFHDKLKTEPILTFYELDAVKFKALNQKGYGVFKAVNEFEATPEQMKEAKVSTKRNNIFVTKLVSAFCDIDISKHGENLSDEERNPLFPYKNFEDRIRTLEEEVADLRRQHAPINTEGFDMTRNYGSSDDPK